MGSDQNTSTFRGYHQNFMFISSRHKILSRTKYLGSERAGCQQQGWMICPPPLEDVGLP